MDGFGPDGLPSAVVLSFDNLGEASALERGELSAATRRDPSVTRALPRLLDELDRHGLRATFFVEAINCKLYPDALREIAARGHELGHHGWQHETWSDLTPDAEREAFDRGVAAFAALGSRPRGFRPPGGALTPRSPALLREHGFAWCSPEGQDATVEDGLAYVPFDWDLVDAYHLMDSFAPLRVRRGDPETPRGHSEVADRMIARLSAPGRRTLILHPFLTLDEAWAAGGARVLEALAGLSGDGRAWVVPGNVFADWQLGRS